ncbi:lipid A export ATP-binding/permease protein MsbA [Lysobacter helvus]|uniref:Lipid A export ATP-binding/permease protein MsbA n=2 Tax=Lysobacteraceae TaxID=32033 RepID=A0ABN6G165_9GAMM|nr:MULTISPECIES: lipid A export permease/ATP-binding protein MsbA [Lysobacter]BCT93508.1 lipid A export ATP-binding/permease protein MsbA [Lysobacter caseinilyticus]BCT96661.1 lipid A export ATP-binding/permease protein MsbA [Lysobacter helvus]
MTAATPAQTYRRLLGYAKPYRAWLGIAAFAMMLEAAASYGITRLLKPIVDGLADPKSFEMWLPAALIGLFIARGLCGLAGDYTMARSGRGVARDLRLLLMGKYFRLPGERFDAEPVASMLTRLGGDTEQVAQAAVDALKVMISASLMTVAMLWAMLDTSWRVTIALLLLAPALVFAMNKVGSRYRNINHRILENAADMLQSADQALHGHQEVKIYGAQDAEIGRYAAQTQKNLQLALKVEVTRGSISFFVQVLGAMGMALLLFLAAREAAAGRLTAGDFTVLMTAMVGIIPPLRQLTNVQAMLQRGVNSAERVFTVIDTPDERDTGTTPLPRAKGLLEFRNVTARYAGQTRPAIQDISFTARPGTVTAIVGRSGSGKTTLIKLIPRFYEPESGQVLLDGQPIDAYPLGDLRRQVAMVSQRVILFDASIADNVAYGEMMGAEPAKLASAVRGANAMEFVERLPSGLDTRIGEHGGRLSGGQRQRLAIARALLKDAPILILDEATAALDNESERLVQDALDHLMPDRTTLVIAHRLSTIEHADQVLVLDEGRLVEQGTHAELLARGGVYAHLHRMQFRDAPAEA